MQLIDKKLTKLYYTIGEVAEMFKVNTSLIRFWEKEFSILKPKKNKKGNRLFTVKDIKNLEKIYDLVKIKGFTLDGAKKALKSYKVTEGQSEKSGVDRSVELEVMERLEKVKLKLLKINSEI
ncbi:MAG: MerR family transcriptional regulator [Putridiphycobacter sp.]